MSETINRLVDVHEVARRLGCSTRHIYDLIRRGAFPAPRKLGSLSRWALSTVETYLRQGDPACPAGTDRA